MHTIKVLPATEHSAVREIKPQVLRELAPHALVACGWDLDAIVQLQQVLRVLALLPLFRPCDHLLHVGVRAV